MLIVFLIIFFVEMLVLNHMLTFGVLIGQVAIAMRPVRPLRGVSGQMIRNMVTLSLVPALGVASLALSLGRFNEAGVLGFGQAMGALAGIVVSVLMPMVVAKFLPLGGQASSAGRSLIGAGAQVAATGALVATGGGALAAGGGLSKFVTSGGGGGGGPSAAELVAAVVAVVVVERSVCRRVRRRRFLRRRRRRCGRGRRAEPVSDSSVMTDAPSRRIGPARTIGAAALAEPWRNDVVGQRRRDGDGDSVGGDVGVQPARAGNPRVSDVEFPPTERVNLFGNFSRGELIGAAAATAVFGVGVVIGQLVPSLVLTVLIAAVDVHTDAPPPVPPDRAGGAALVAATGPQLVGRCDGGGAATVVPAWRGRAARRRAARPGPDRGGRRCPRRTR